MLPTSPSCNLNSSDYQDATTENSELATECYIMGSLPMPRLASRGLHNELSACGPNGDADHRV